jgi:F-type H+-transporting ATPase subunit epsilon
MHLRVVTPRGSKVDAQVAEVTIPGEMGDLGVLPGHRALLTSVGIGGLSWKPVQGEIGWLAINGGYAEVVGDEVVVITETAERPTEIDVQRAEAALARVGAELRAVDASRGEEVARLQLALRRAENRLAVAKRAKPVIPA